MSVITTNVPDDAPRALGAAVIVRAIQDFRNPLAGATTKTSNALRNIKEDARHFLTDASGPWARARREWCEMADVDPDLLRGLILAGRLEVARDLFRGLQGRRPALDEVGAAAHG